MEIYCKGLIANIISGIFEVDDTRGIHSEDGAVIFVLVEAPVVLATEWTLGLRSPGPLQQDCLQVLCLPCSSHTTLIGLTRLMGAQCKEYGSHPYRNYPPDCAFYQVLRQLGRGHSNGTSLSRPYGVRQETV